MMKHLGLAALTIASITVLTMHNSYAACSSPAGAEADIRYDSAAKMMYFCDDTNWVPTANLSATASGPSSSLGQPCNNCANGTVIDVAGSYPSARFAHISIGISSNSSSWSNNTVAFRDSSNSTIYNVHHNFSNGENDSAYGDSNSVSMMVPLPKDTDNIIVQKSVGGSAGASVYVTLWD